MFLQEMDRFLMIEHLETLNDWSVEIPCNQSSITNSWSNSKNHRAEWMGNVTFAASKRNPIWISAYFYQQCIIFHRTHNTRQNDSSVDNHHSVIAEESTHKIGSVFRVWISRNQVYGCYFMFCLLWISIYLIWFEFRALTKQTATTAQKCASYLSVPFSCWKNSNADMKKELIWYVIHKFLWNSRTWNLRNMHTRINATRFIFYEHDQSTHKWRDDDEEDVKRKGGISHCIMWLTDWRRFRHGSTAELAVYSWISVWWKVIRVWFIGPFESSRLQTFI